MANISKLLSWTDLPVIQERSLIVLDIDETFLWFPTINEIWWKELLHSLQTKYGPETSHILARKEWERVVSNEAPVQTDMVGFRNLNDRIRDTKSKLIFMTARLESIAPLTRKHLRDCGVSSDIEVHYTTGKGETLRHIMQRNPMCSEVIFVDDKVSNIYDVQYHNPSVKVYQWVPIQIPMSTS